MSLIQNYTTQDAKRPQEGKSNSKPLGIKKTNS